MQSNPLRKILSSLLGKRLPLTTGSLEVSGLQDPVTIRRDKWGVPHIEAGTDVDAWYGLGFCHGQDRAFQVETLLRVIRGTLAELVGKDGVAIDRLSRRLGLGRKTDEQFRMLDADLQAHVEGYVRGLYDGATTGSAKKAHEFALLFAKPSRWNPSDVMGMARLQSFLFATNADAELARLKILLADGPNSLAAVDPCYGKDWQGVLWAEAVEPAVDRLGEDLAAVDTYIAPGGASNSWAVSPGLTATGRPIVANDPHLPALLPSPWYLAHLKTPEWSVAGATLVGAPAVEVGHNGHACWGVTAALFDNTDLFQEEMGPDGQSVRSGEEFIPCEVRTERIKVRYGRSIGEQVAVTPRGPIVGPALDKEAGALSVSAFWLEPQPLEGFLRVHHARSFDQFRHYFVRWPGPDLNLTYADVSGTIGWQMVGMVPVRKKGWGTVPLPGWDPSVGWEAEPVPFEEMPYGFDPDLGYLATANSLPYPPVSEPFLGIDWIDGYRLARIMERLGEDTAWDVKSTQALQLDELSIPWRDMRDVVLGVKTEDPAARKAQALLADWDGLVSADSPAAAVFEFLVAELARRVARAKAPNSSDWVLGLGFGQLQPYTTFSYRRVGHLVRLLRNPVKGWFEHSWEVEIASALSAVTGTLRDLRGDDSSEWAWGKVRPIILRHPVGEQKPLNRVFDIGPIHWGGDSNTIAQTSVDPIRATNDPGFIASLRMVADVGNWDDCRWVLPAGQSGNPFSPHYDDQLALWKKGDGIAIPWKPEAVEEATVAELTLIPKR